VCGFPEESCLHQLFKQAKIRDTRLNCMLWFSIGFVAAIGIILIEILWD
jgi:hypothetical protein